LNLGQYGLDGIWLAMARELLLDAQERSQFAAVLHFVDRRFCQGDDLPQFLSLNGATEGEGLRFGD